jgi:TolB-like protein
MLPSSPKTQKPLPLPDKPSIAVLPFQNMSGDPEQEYFADGIVEDIITALSHFNMLFVISRTSSFIYKGKSIDIKKVGQELGVRYVVEGSVRRAANKIRITGQLIDASTSMHLWADHFDGMLDDIFDLQDQVTTNVVAAIAPKVRQAEMDRARRKPNGNLDAYDQYLRALSEYYKRTRDGTDLALSLLTRAITEDPEFACAWGLAAMCYQRRKVNGWFADPKKEMAEAERLARRAAELGEGDADALSWSAMTRA